MSVRRAVFRDDTTHAYDDGVTDITSEIGGGGSYTDEQAQDAVGGILTDTATVDFTYDDATPKITADVVAGFVAVDTHAASSKTTPADADEFALVDSAASNVLKKLTGTNLKAYLKSYFDGIYSGTGSGIPADGWQSLSGLSYSSADAPTFVIGTSSDLSGTISVGCRMRLVQTTTKYFIVTAIDSSTITVYGGTDYTLANAAISSPYFSNIKAPYGFPLDPAKWTVSVITDTSSRTQGSPTSGTWYNLGSLSGDIPIGCWLVFYEVSALGTKNSSVSCNIKTALSTANNTASDAELLAHAQTGGASGTSSISVEVHREKHITLATKTTYYLNAMSTSTATTIAFNGDLATTVVRAVCAYL